MSVALSDVELGGEPEQVAVIGMAGRFPGARNVGEFWRNLREGVEAIVRFPPEELAASGIDEVTMNDPRFVNAGTIMPDSDSFDAAFFGVSTREAEIMDPQHRVLLETAWQALEDAGYDPEDCQGSIGVFGGVAPNTYLLNNLVTRPGLLQTLGRYAVMLGSEKDYAITRVSFKLNLRGPSVCVNTACSTSGVAVHLACQSLLSGECDMALAGGARISVPLRAGYMYQEGGILSPDGHCRAFDAQARGTVVGNGVAVVVLKRLSEAARDRDHIYAVIRGSAINNDGSRKVGFTAPSIQGQATAIEESLLMAGVSPDSIGYVEAHGTGTSLGDPIEIAALTNAYGKHTNRRGDCPIGSVKTNIGHLDAAAGVTGLIKVILALENEEIPPSLNFRTPNPQIDFANSPFFVVTERLPWPATGTPRRAGVSSFGLGGANAHIIVEEGPRPELSGRARSHQLLVLSARSDAALARATDNLAQHLRHKRHLNLADVAYTLQTGRRAFAHRRMAVCRDVDEAIVALESAAPRRAKASLEEAVGRRVVFMFSGQGSQYVNMGLGLYQSEPRFRREVDRCAELLKPHLALDLRQTLYPDREAHDEAGRMLQQTYYTQPALFVVEYALAMQWLDWGVRPQALVGHSIGEYVAACLAGVFSLEEALFLVAARGRLMQALPSGSMLVVPLKDTQVEPLMDDRVCIAALNGPSLCVVSGEDEAVSDLETRLARDRVETRRLRTSHAFHSRMMDPILDDFADEVRKVRLSPPRIPFLSNVTGTWILPDEAVDPDYWARQLRHSVQFSACLDEMFREPDTVLLEVGPGQTLATLARRHRQRSEVPLVLSSTRHPQARESDVAFILNTVGQLWLAGVRVDWSGFHAAERRNRVSLPTYPFERRRYWIEAARPRSEHERAEAETTSEPQTDVLGTSRHGQGPATACDGAPASAAQASLVRIWQGLLGVDELTIHDNFFEIGGSSLLATRLFTSIAEQFGKTLPLATIFEAPTIEQLAAMLEQKPASAGHSSLIRVRDGEAWPPLYLLPGNLGNVYRDLGYISRHLGPDRPVYGLQDGIGHPSSVAALAAHYVDDIRRVQPDGPYLLGGICSGGVVAFEMAQQVLSGGHSVALLALVEPASLSLPGARSYLSLAAEVWERSTRRIGARSADVSHLSWAERSLYARLRLKLIANLWALKRYRPQPYPGDCHLFLTAESRMSGARLGWCQFVAGGVSVHELPGTHRSITGDHAHIEEAHMQVLAAKLKECIDDGLRRQQRI